MFFVTSYFINIHKHWHMWLNKLHKLHPSCYLFLLMLTYIFIP